MANHSDKKTKVLLVITKSNFGGAQRYVYDLAVGLPHEKFDVAVVVGETGRLVDMLSNKKVRVISIPSLARDINPFKEIKSFFTLWSILRKEKPDVVHLNSAKASGMGALSARLTGIPKIIFTAHGWAFNENRPYIQRIIIKFLSWFTVMLSHETIAVSDAIKNDTKNWPLVGKKITVIKNGIIEPDFFDKETALKNLFDRAGITLPASALIIGTVAELHKNKGLQYAIEAFSKISSKKQDVYYFILGDGEEKERLNALVEHYNLQGRVFLLGFVEDAPRFLKAFDIFLLPSITEALGLAILEAGAAGLPVIASNVGGIPEIITNEETGVLVPSRNTEAIYMAINCLTESPALRKLLGEALHSKVVQRFSFERSLEETFMLYEKI